MIKMRYSIPKEGAGTEEDPYRPEWTPTEVGESLRVVREAGDDLVCDVVATDPLPYTRVW